MESQRFGVQTLISFVIKNPVWRAFNAETKLTALRKETKKKKKNKNKSRIPNVPSGCAEYFKSVSSVSMVFRALVEWWINRGPVGASCFCASGDNNASWIFSIPLLTAFTYACNEQRKKKNKLMRLNSSTSYRRDNRKMPKNPLEIRWNCTHAKSPIIFISFS